MACAKLVGSVDHFCMPCPAEGKCIRCFNLNLQCQPVRDVDAGFFPKVQQYFQFYDLQTAFEARKSWFDRMDGTVGLLNLALFGNQLDKVNHNLEQLINLQLEKVSGFAFVCLCNVWKRISNYYRGYQKPVDASSEAEEERSQRSKIQEHRERITELESSIARNTAEYEMYTNKNLKQKISMYVEYLKLDLEKAKTSLAKLEAEKVA